MAGRRAEKREDLKARLIEAARNRIASDGMANLRARDVTQDAGCGLATLDEAEETLARLRTRQSQNETIASVLKEMDSTPRSAGIIEKLANAGCGAPLRSSADDVLARLRARSNNVA